MKLHHQAAFCIFVLQLTFAQMCAITEHKDNFYAFQFMNFQDTIFEASICMRHSNPYTNQELGWSSLLSLSPKAATCRGWISSQFRQQHQSILCFIAPGVGDSLLKIHQPTQSEQQPVAEELIICSLERPIYWLIAPHWLPILQQKYRASFWSRDRAYSSDNGKGASVPLGRNLHIYHKGLKAKLVLPPACLSYSYCFSPSPPPQQNLPAFVDWLTGLKNASQQCFTV